MTALMWKGPTARTGFSRGQRVMYGSDPSLYGTMIVLKIETLDDVDWVKCGIDQIERPHEDDTLEERWRESQLFLPGEIVLEASMVMAKAA
jgi:hypothetical protein